MNEYFPVEVLPTTVPMRVHAAVSSFRYRSPPSVRWPEPPVAAFGREHALSEIHNARVATFERLAQQDYLMLAL